MAITGGTATGPVMVNEAEQVSQQRIGEVKLERDILKKALAVFSRLT